MIDALARGVDRENGQHEFLLFVVLFGLYPGIAYFSYHRRVEIDLTSVSWSNHWFLYYPNDDDVHALSEAAAFLQKPKAGDVFSQDKVLAA